MVAPILLAVVGMAALSGHEAFLGATFVLASVRSGLLYRSRPARSLLIEGFLIGFGLLFGGFLGGPSPIGMALGLWGFMLIQSLFVVIGGLETRPGTESEGDPFARARARATALMDEPAQP